MEIKEAIAVIAIAPEGVERRKDLFAQLAPEAVALRESQVEIPATPATVISMDFKGQKVKKNEWAMALLGALAGLNKLINLQMPDATVADRFKGDVLRMTREPLAKTNS